MELDITRECVYFFKHIGLSPVKVGFSSSCSPLHRFENFTPYSPYGSQILGFVITSNAKALQLQLHNKFASRRLEGEWFEITEQEVKYEIDLHTSISDINDINDFQIAWAKFIFNKKENYELENLPRNGKKGFDDFKSLYLKDNNINRSHTAVDFNVTRKTVHDWIKKIQFANKCNI